MNKIINLLKKYEEVISYLIFGVLTTAVSIVTYFIFSKFLFTSNSQLDIQICNVLSWICAVIFAYITNKIFVFKSKKQGKEIIKEIISFVSARILSLIIDMSFMFIMTYFMHIDDMIAKLIVQVIVIVLNYILSKIFVFKNSKEV